MDAQAYIDEMRAKKRRNLIIGAVIALILAAMILPGLFGKKGPDEEDLEAALTRQKRIWRIPSWSRTPSTMR